MREKIVAGNWKMNCTLDEGKKLTSEIINMVATEVNSDVKVILNPPFIHLTTLKALIGDSEKVYLGAQNCNENESGAFTGEVSTAMLKSIEVDYVIIGHSERREYFEESDELLAQKVKKVLDQGLTPIFCCGEKLESREAGEQEKIVKDQIKAALFNLTDEEIRKVVIAYEPVWAIGTGKTATADQAQEMHAYIRKELSAQFSEATGQSLPILYGGSVKPGNAQEIFSKPDVDGGLIGGASLKSRDFVDIIKASS